MGTLLHNLGSRLSYGEPNIHIIIIIVSHAPDTVTILGVGYLTSQPNMRIASSNVVSCEPILYNL